MIISEQLIEVGYITKLHGLKGEMQATVTDPVFDDVKKCPYLVCQLDGIYVPFFIQNYRFRSDTSMLLTFEDIDTQEKAAILWPDLVFRPSLLHQAGGKGL